MDRILNIILGIPFALAQTASTAKSGSTPTDVIAFVVENLPFWITAFIVFGVSLILGFVVKSTVESRLAAKITSEHQEVLIISGRVAFVITLTIGTSIALAIAGINLTTLIAAIGFGISFGLQDTISNFVAGLAILGSKPFTLGDWIKVDGNVGKVIKISTRATYLQTYDGLRLIVPNSQLYKGQVLSYTSNPLRRMKVPVYTRYLIDLKDVRDICMNVIKDNPKIFQSPKPNLVVIDFADFYMYLELRFWVDSKGLWRRIQSDVFARIQKKLEEAGLDSPYPVTSLSMEEDIEDVVFRSKSMDDSEFSKLMNQRMQEEEKFAKRRAELTSKAAKKNISITPIIPNQTGAAFLQTQEAPSATPQPAANPAPQLAAENPQPLPTEPLSEQLPPSPAN